MTFAGAMRCGAAATALVVIAPFSADAADMPGLRDSAHDLPTVRDRVEGTGLRAGSYWILPTVEGGYFYNSNPLARSRDEKSGDGVYTTVNVEAKSDFGRHALNFFAGMEHYEYFDLSRQSYTDGYGGTEFQVDIQRDLVLLGGVNGGYFHQQLGDVNTPGNAAEPIPYTNLESWGSINKAFNRLSVSLGMAYRDRNYSDVDAIGGGKLDQDFRDSEVIIGGGRVSYLFSPGYRIFGDFRYNDRHYRKASFNDSHGYRALGGVAFEITRLLAGEVGVGYMWQDYKESSEGTEDGLSYHLGLTWIPTPLVTVNFAGDRVIEDSSVPGDPARILTEFDMVVDYEFRRNIIISPAFGIADNEYSNSRNDNFSYEAGIDVDYYLNRYLSVGANYKYLNRNYKRREFDFDRHVVGVNAKARF